MATHGDFDRLTFVWPEIYVVISQMHELQDLGYVFRIVWLTAGVE